MKIRTKRLAAALSLILAIGVPFAGAVTFFPTEVMAEAARKSTLPKPYVSRALRAVLMPVTTEVARKFKLAKGARGVMVVSVKPDGLGKLAGLKPGDVIGSILGRPVRKPADVDTIVAWFLKGGTEDFQISGIRKSGRTYRAATVITPTYFYEPFDVSTVSAWSSFSYETYSYSEYVSYYSQVITTSYERSESYIEETITSTTFNEEMTSETNYDFSSYDEQIVDGSYVEGGSGPVWQDGQTEVVYDPADDPALLEVPSDPAADSSSDGSDPFAVSEGDPNYDAASAEADSGDAGDPLLYGEDGSGSATDGSGTMDATVDDGSGTMDATVDDGSGTMDAAFDDGSGADQGCAGGVVDGVCSDGSTDAGAYDQSSSGDTGGGDTGGDMGGEEYVPQE